MITDRLRHTVLEMNTNKILSRDLTTKEMELQVNLSAPARLSFKVDHGQRYASSYGIQWKKYGQWIVSELEIDYVKKIVACSIVTECKIDRKTGDMILETTGFMGYPKGIPWLENFNPIAVDPFEVIQRVWAHCQSYINANLGVQVLPAVSGTQMLPGYAYDGNILAFDFFALFIRAVDFGDCGDQIVSLARDLPIDMVEEASWNADRTELTKVLRLAYPYGGLKQEHLSFRLGDNVIDAEYADDLDTEPATDVIVRSWAPGRVINTSISNADMTRARRIIMEEDANINSTERAAALAKRRLQKRNVPKSFQKITIDPSHINAPFGSWWLGDSIRVQARDYPWVGDIDEWHRIVSINIKDGEPFMELGLKVEGAFNYDPIEYDPDYDEEPTEDPNLLTNGYFGSNMSGWKSNRGQWIRTSQVQYGDTGGAVRIDCDDNGEELESHKVVVTPGETVRLSCVVRYSEVTSTDAVPGFLLRAGSYNSGGFVSVTTVDYVNDPEGAAGWQILEGDFVVPVGTNEVTLRMTVDASVTGGIAYWTYARILR